MAEMSNLESISSTFYARIFCTKVLCAACCYLHVTREKLPKSLSYEKGARKMLMELTPVPPYLRIVRTSYLWMNQMKKESNGLVLRANMRNLVRTYKEIKKRYQTGKSFLFFQWANSQISLTSPVFRKTDIENRGKDLFDRKYAIHAITTTHVKC